MNKMIKFPVTLLMSAMMAGCFTGEVSNVNESSLMEGQVRDDLVVVHGELSSNAAPSAYDDQLSVVSGEVLLATLKANDAEKNKLTYMLVIEPVKGVATLNTNTGALSYTPDAGQTGMDSLQFMVNDGTSDSNLAMVDIEILPAGSPPPPPANTKPVAKNMAITGLEDQSQAATFDASDFESDPLTFSIVSAPSMGQVVISGGQFLYTPDADAYGVDSFTYRANDGQANSNVASVTVTVTSVNDLPTAVSDAAATDQDVTAQFNVLTNDSGLGDAPISTSIVGAPANGVANINGAGLLTYTPDAGYFGSESITYRVQDIDGDQAIATAMITVNCLSNCTKVLQLSWTASVSADVTGYKVYVGNAAGTYTETLSVGDVVAYDYTATAKGDYYFAVTAINSAAIESDYSNEASGIF